MKKKGSIQDIAFAMIILFAMAIVFLSVKYSYTEFVERAINNTVVNESSSSVAVFTQTRDMTDRWDYILFALLMGFTFAILISAWFAGGHPIFAFMYFIALVLIVTVSAILSFVWEKVSEDTILSSVAAELPIIDLILRNFPIYIAVLGFVGLMIMFSRPAMMSQ